jgi:isocitrate dehydrogenase
LSKQERCNHQHHQAAEHQRLRTHLKGAIAELQSKGFTVPTYPDEPQTEEEKEIKVRYAKVLGSAVNPVLREGNSDRRVPAAVKRYARKHPHPMGKWSPASRTHVAHVRGGDFYSSEKCMTMDHACEVRMDLVTKYGEEILLKEKTPLLAGELIDNMFMRRKRPRSTAPTRTLSRSPWTGSCASSRSAARY